MLNKPEIKNRVNAALEWSNSTGISIWESAWMPGNYNKGNDYDIERQNAFSSVSTETWTDLEPVVDHIISLPLVEQTSTDNSGSSSFELLFVLLLVFQYRLINKHGYELNSG